MVHVMYSERHAARTVERGQVYGHSSRVGVRRLGGGIALALALFVVGYAAKSGPGTDADLAVSHLIAHIRNPVFTGLAELLTLLFTPEAWAALGVVGAIVLALVRRRGQALRVFCVMIGSTAVVYVAKAIVSEPRPPKSLWLEAPDSNASFPSGHTMAAAAVAACALILVPAAARSAVRVAGIMVVVAVAGSRMYLGVHYLLDVTGSVLAVGCATVFLSGLALLPPGRRWLLALDGAGVSPSPNSARR